MQQYEVSQRQRRGLHRPHRKVDSATLTGEEATALCSVMSTILLVAMRSSARKTPNSPRKEQLSRSKHDPGVATTQRESSAMALKS